MLVEESICFCRFTRLCKDAFDQGWHEANGGNLSYRMSEHDLASCKGEFSVKGSWHELGHAYPALSGEYIMLTGSGRHLRNASLEPEKTLGVIELDERGAAWRCVWGLEKTGPSSELETHLMAYDAAIRAGDGADRVVYHAHGPNVIALSTLIEPSARAWTRFLWQCMTESIIVFPAGIGVVPWMVPGSAELAQETRRHMEKYRVCIWTQHGLMVRATGFDEAFGLVHTVEKSSGIYLNALAANGGKEPRYLVSDEQLRAICERYGLTPNEEFLR